MTQKRNVSTDHTFVVCAYGENPYLEQTVRSLVHQTVRSRIIIATSTPNAHITGIAEKYGIPCLVNEGESGITQDWNFGYAMAQTKYITIAHQDDLYGRTYTEEMLRAMGVSQKPLIFFTDYAEIRNDEIVSSNTLLRIKRLLLLPLVLGGALSPSRARRSVLLRRMCLCLGSPVCCPSVTFARENLPEEPFLHHFRADEDWEAWERFSKLQGDFLYCRKVLTFHRIYEESETSKILQENKRTQEDLYMFRKFWPEPVAKILAKLYQASEKSNRV